MFNLLADTYPKTTMQVLLVPAIILVVALAIWYAGVLLETRLEIKHVKWAAAVPILVGLVMGFQNMMKLRDPFYTGIVDQDRIQMAHYVTFVMPIIGAGIIAAWYFISKKKQDITF